MKEEIGKNVKIKIIKEEAKRILESKKINETEKSLSSNFVSPYFIPFNLRYMDFSFLTYVIKKFFYFFFNFRINFIIICFHSIIITIIIFKIFFYF